MAAITAELVKQLRSKTGAGIMDCKEALKAKDGNLEEASRYLREKGLLKAEKKMNRAANNGKITAYIHGDGKIGVLLEINCETDFVARTEDFNALAREMSMQIAAMAPAYVSEKDVPVEEVEREKEIYRTEAKNTGKPEKVIDKIVEGKLKKYYSQNCLLNQPYIRDDSKTIEDLVKGGIAKLGENIVIKRFSRFVLGA